MILLYYPYPQSGWLEKVRKLKVRDIIIFPVNDIRPNQIENTFWLDSIVFYSYDNQGNIEFWSEK